MKSIHLVHLYPKEMNIYGDTGNRLVLQKRLEWRGFKVKVSLVGVGDAVPTDADIIIGGGGQDAGQSQVQQDLQAKADSLHKLANDGVVMLMVCGLYQLFGRHFLTHEGDDIIGIGILPLETVGGPKRMIGNTIYDTDFGPIVGYENHSGVTKLDDNELALGKVVKGDGNNGEDGFEGCVVNNVFGTYSHGPILSKNPRFADELISRAIDRHFGTNQLEELDDTLELQAAAVATKRPR